MPLEDAKASALAIPPIVAGADEDSNNGDEESEDGCRCNELGIESPLAIELVDDDAGDTPFNDRVLFKSGLELVSDDGEQREKMN